MTIGVRFHWERREAQTFPGDLTFLPAGTGVLAAINELPVEEYLASVVSSEMSGEAPYAFLKAHAIASRSWLVAMLERRGGVRERRTSGNRCPREGEVVRWYDREDHTRFDVCADDHCQRYQGIAGRVAGRAAEAVRETRGVFLIHEGAICDARYHKACGGMTENFEPVGRRLRFPTSPTFPTPQRPRPLSGPKRTRNAGSFPVPTSPAARTIWRSFGGSFPRSTGKRPISSAGR